MASPSRCQLHLSRWATKENEPHKQTTASLSSSQPATPKPTPPTPPTNRSHTKSRSRTHLHRNRPTLADVNTRAAAAAPSPVPSSPPIIRLPPPTTTQNPSPRPSPPPSPTRTRLPLRPDVDRAAAELLRYTRIVRRMEWKHPFLDMGYARATARADPDPALAAEADVMFKLDFFEYYRLLESAIVHLQQVFGVTISRSASPVRPPPPRPTSSSGGLSASRHNSASPERGGQKYQHRYHANVLAALDRPENPLHGALGTPEVRHALGRAKDLRNRWKKADETGPEGRAAAGQPLESYDLKEMLGVILGALNGAYLEADRYIAGLRAEQQREKQEKQHKENKENKGSGEMKRLDWADEVEMELYDGGLSGEAMVDAAMDWEAV